MLGTVRCSCILICGGFIALEFCFVLFFLLLLLLNSFEALQEERFLLVGIVPNGGIVVPVVILGTNSCSWFTKLSLRLKVTLIVLFIGHELLCVVILQVNFTCFGYFTERSLMLEDSSRAPTLLLLTLLEPVFIHRHM